jgi:predicted TIM-barrel fold metal-dependent hydrolase
VDFAGLIWSYPIKEVNRYIERLVDAGFEDLVMFGTDQLIWPKPMAYSISIIQNADYLTAQQKRDILIQQRPRDFGDRTRSGQVSSSWPAEHVPV